jgi:hypothetical protein
VVALARLIIKSQCAHTFDNQRQTVFESMRTAANSDGYKSWIFSRFDAACFYVFFVSKILQLIMHFVACCYAATLGACTLMSACQFRKMDI